ncbi:MAG: SDR family oxidoreductase [Bryobacteraceae bacterium]|nr:SDR family oxidoreductase [Bryobacteraceae bacterium]MDW8380307.1 SDR family oxidoreductase [Bryobacterales bacterium]
MSFDLTCKVALVTGGGRGIGRAIALRFATAGANVVIASRKAENLIATAKSAEHLPGRIVPIPCHVGRPDQLQKLVEETERSVGPIDILVNNSATNVGQGPALEVTDEALLKTTEINVLAPHRLIRLIVPKMIERGQGGSIINIASIAGLRPQPEGLAYSFTKAGLIMMTRIWAIEFGKHRIRVNAICPGLIQTDFSEYFWKDEEYMERLRQTQPLAYLGQPDEIAGMALYLASDESSYVTGQCMVIDGGATAR